MSPTRLAVLGGGAAGMAAALAAVARGWEVTLHEAAPALGGAIRTLRDGEWLAEAGPNTVMEPDPAVRALLDGAGLAERVIRPGTAAARRYIVHGGTPVAVPGSAAELLATPLLSVPGRLRLLKEPFVAPSPPGAEETVDAFARRRFGDEVAERFFDPLLAGTSGADPRAVLVRHAFPRLLAFEQEGGSVLKGARRAASRARAAGTGRPSLGLWSCPEGLAEVPARIAAHLGARVRTGVPARLVPAGDGIAVAWGGEQRAVDAAVVALPPPAARAAVAALPGSDGLAPLDALPLASIASCSLGYPREAVAHPLDGFGVLAPSGERRAVLGVLFPSAIFAGRAPAGHVLLTAFVGGMRQPELAEASEARIEAVVREELAALLGVRGAPAFRAVTRWPAALPQAVAGHGARLAAAEAWEGAMPAVALAGNWRDGLAVGEAMLGGVRAVERLAARRTDHA